MKVRSPGYDSWPDSLKIEDHFQFQQQRFGPSLCLASHFDRTCRHRLNLLRMYAELNERWHRMDALNAGLVEAVRSKTALQASVESAELLLVKQVWVGMGGESVGS